MIGGTFDSKSDLLDKILLANQMATQAQKIYLLGEFGLAAVSCLLNKPVSKVEDSVVKDGYLQYRRFFKKLFAKAEEYGCQIILPKDFVIGAKIDKEECLAEYD